MANVIERVQISGFWGSKTVDLPLNRSLNFLIGANGSGKTTIIEILNAALLVNLDKLARTDFKKIDITLKSKKSNKKPKIIIEKKGSEFFDSSILYWVYHTSSSSPEHYEFEEYDNPRLPPALRHSSVSKQNRGYLRSTISELINISWLPILRTHQESHSPFNYDEGIRDFIDIKLDAILSGFTRYFSEMQTNDQKETDSFQEDLFLSILHKSSNLSKILSPSVDLDSEKYELKQIMREFRVDPGRSSGLIDRHFSMLDIAIEKAASSEVLKVGDVGVLLDNARLVGLVEQWIRLRRKRERIYQTRNSFLEIMNNRLSRKKIKINERNEVLVETQSGKTLSPHEMSSGEKQIFILLGEALLCEKKHFTYIADEPEISLHIEWQSSLADSLKELNPNLQIIFATHSPDIVGEHEEFVVPVEGCIS